MTHEICCVRAYLINQKCQSEKSPFAKKGVDARRETAEILYGLQDSASQQALLFVELYSAGFFRYTRIETNRK